MIKEEAKPHILLVEDARDIREPLARYFREHNYRATTAQDAASARKVMKSAAIDLVVLDIMMPGEDGLSLCRSIRETTQIPVILLTARGEEVDRIIGLEMGADDYLAKPFSPRELLARIRSILRRTRGLPAERGGSAVQQVRFAGWTLDLAARQLVAPDGVVVALSGAEFKLLSVFVEHPNRVLDRNQLMDLTVGRDGSPFDRSIDVQVSRLRLRLRDDAREPRIIKTVRNEGYVLAAVVERLG